jgi:hypothetical protein
MDEGCRLKEIQTWAKSSPLPTGNSDKVSNLLADEEPLKSLRERILGIISARKRKEILG